MRPFSITTADHQKNLNRDHRELQSLIGGNHCCDADNVLLDNQLYFVLIIVHLWAVVYSDEGYSMVRSQNVALFFGLKYLQSCKYVHSIVQ